MVPEPPLVERFRRDLDALIAPHARIGIAVSGGPDSLALLLLAAAARPGGIEAATVDHALRDGSRAEADLAATVCRRLGLSHAILTAEWADKPDTAVQERARAERYRLLAAWTRERGLQALATAHHADDQAETVLMRLNRGAGVRGLAGMRAVARLPGSDLALLRPLLGWRHSELAKLCEAAGIEPAQDPSNQDDRFERVRMRRAMAESGSLDPDALARSAANLAMADEALDWAADRLWAQSVGKSGDELVYERADAPAEIERRIVARAVTILASEGAEEPLRGAELDRLLSALADRGTMTLRGVLCRGGDRWSFASAPPRRRK
jgi:tRNA(Ile)-lysidine synthase